MTSAAIYRRLWVSWVPLCSSRTTFTAPAPFRNSCSRSRQQPLGVRCSHVGTSCTSGVLKSPAFKNCQRTSVHQFSLLKYLTTSTEEPSNGDSIEDDNFVAPESHEFPAKSSVQGKEMDHKVEHRDVASSSAKLDLNNLNQGERDSDSSDSDINSSDSDTDSSDSDIDSSDSEENAGLSIQTEVPSTDENGSTSQEPWPEEDGIVIYTDQEFLTKRQQRALQKKEPDSSDTAPPSSTQDQYNLRSLLENIQRQQDEQKEKEHRVARTTMMSVEELVEFLRKDNAREICVIAVPPEMDYVEYFVVCSGTGSRHIGRMADHLANEVHLHGKGFCLGIKLLGQVKPVCELKV